MRLPPPPPATHRSIFSEAQEQSPDASAVVYRATDFEHSVHLDNQSQIMAGNGKVEELASLAAYVCRMGSLIGHQFGAGAITGIETTLDNGVFLIHRDAQGEIVAIKPRPHLNLVQLKAQLHL